MTRFLEISESLTKIGFCATVPCNLVLIYLTSFHTRQITGAYKHMLIFFATSCILFSSLELLVRPFTHNFNGSFVYFSLNDYMGLSQRFLQYAIALYAGFYAMNVAFIAVQFVFRFWTLIDHRGLRSFYGKGRLIWVFYLLFVLLAYSFSILLFLQPNDFHDGYVREDFRKYYSKDISEYPRFFIIPYEHFPNSTRKRVRWENMSFLFSAIPILSFQYMVVIYCTVQMQMNMQLKLKNFSGINRALQIQFFRALVVQIILPTLLYSLPAIPVLLVPILDLKMSVQSGLVVGLFSVYPPLDSLALMFIVSENSPSNPKVCNSDKQCDTWQQQCDPAGEECYQHFVTCAGAPIRRNRSKTCYQCQERRCLFLLHFSTLLHINNHQKMTKPISVLLLILLVSATVAQSPISCAFCVSGLAQINQQILSSPDMQAQMGIQASQGCDQIPVKQTRQTCRTTMNTHFNTFYTSFAGQESNSPTQMCINMGMC